MNDEDRRFHEIAFRLATTYGFPEWTSHGPPLDELIATVLSQHTSDVNTARSYASLRRLFPNWSQVLAAPTAAVADAIRGGGLANIKAPRIQCILQAVQDTTSDLSLDWLADWQLSEARKWLINLPGVGPKTAACVLLFSLGLPVMPVDTHVFRVSRRLGLINDRVPAALADAPLERLTGLDRDRIYALHLNLIQHGRTTCRARTPLCHRCQLAELCPSSLV